MKKYSIRFLFLFFLFSFQVVCFAIDSRGMFWTGADFNVPFRSKSPWYYNMFFQARLTNTQNDLEQLVLRPSIHYKFFNGWSAWLGYDFMPTTASNGVTTFLEQRIWPQVQYKWSVTPRLKISFRSRYEYRWRSNRSDQSQRFRERVMFSIANITRGGVDFDIFDEVFFNLNHPSWATDHAINRNWAFAGFAIPIYKYFAIDVGYLNIVKQTSSARKMDHVAIFMLSTSFDDDVDVPIEVL